MKRHVFWHFVSAKNLNCGVFQTKFLVELETVKFCVLFCLAWDYSFVSGSQLRLVVLVSCVQLLCFRRAGTHFSSIHHWIDQQKLMALNILVKSWKIFWFRLYSGHFKQSGKNNLCLLNYFIVKISVPRRMLRKNETYSKTS